MSKGSAFVLPDEDVRKEILSSDTLKTNLLVEAAAGTGKTTIMVERMVALLRQPDAPEPSKIAAVTFTRKAAAEIRDRFRDNLERYAENRKVPKAERERLRAAQERVDEVFTGTIHSFCARLLRERPVEAGVGAGFSEVTEDLDAALRQRAWDLYIERLRTEASPLLEELRAANLTPSMLRDAFDTVCLNLDVEEWPTEECPRPDLATVSALAAGWVRYLKTVDTNLPPRLGETSDEFLEWRDRILRMERRGYLNSLEGTMEALGQFVRDPKIKKTKWQGGAKEGKARANEVLDWWKDVKATAERHLVHWREYRYPIAMRVILPGRDIYNAVRREEGVLNFQDLLLKAARLLREDPAARRYFRERFSHLLVDEFQDTDPIQAELLFFLAARPEDDGEKDWKRCSLRPGSLFIVGDPKQAIYRFRRADILTYNEVKAHIEAQGGRVLALRANFRSAPGILDWVNGSFGPRFPASATPHAPAYVPLEKGKEWGEGEGEVEALPLPKELSKKSGLVEYESDLVARALRKSLDGPRDAVRPDHFMVITGNKTNLARYSRMMMELGIPCNVIGGNSFEETPEVVHLARFLRVALSPENPAALVGVLRGPLFGISDDALYRYRRAGGRWSFHSEVPKGLSKHDRKRFSEAYDLLKKCAGWLRALPPLAAIGRTASELGLYPSAGSSDAGNALAGTLAKVIEALRAACAEFWSAVELAAYFDELLGAKMEHDSVPAVPYPHGAVQLMNLHKAKGLEAKTVFLADATGGGDHPPTRHIQRKEGQPKGYLLIREKKGEYQYETHAQPKGWAIGTEGAPSLEEQEKAFLEAERVRLLYVAGTRGKRRLVVSRKPGDRFNYWKDIGESLTGKPEVPDPGPQSAPARKEAALSRPVAEELAAVEARREASRTPSYAKVTPKSLVSFEPTRGAVAAPVPSATEGEGGGAARGTLIHALLEAAMKEPGRDLLPLAQSLLAENDLPIGEATRATETVEAVKASPFWKRAQDASERVVEFPYARMLEGRPLPTLETGVIDLAFKEDGGWVIVDYKTDRGELSDLLARYRPQLAAYRSVWEKAIGPVKEVLLFSVRTRQTAVL